MSTSNKAWRFRYKIIVIHSLAWMATVGFFDVHLVFEQKDGSDWAFRLPGWGPGFLNLVWRLLQGL